MWISGLHGIEANVNADKLALKEVNPVVVEVGDCNIVQNQQ